ncbi:DUF488 domain-containing protein [Tautonia sociabilis]|uniref:DUF488 domain-containing protein n=1 Tax=Tautonia sociabilis TaxID=2080755 RepID=A0A432MNB0_9BACT|nr:DUF488 domain-containing protein [Tautonia sociabilis]RUL88558.1 DUF488 domain-containing protein [Tautonia sociabilis]
MAPDDLDAAQAIGEPRELWTVGYGSWPARERADRLASALSARGVTLLADVRLAPCSSDLDPSRTYGPRGWHLRASGSGEGIVPLLAQSGISYEWFVELGNPQRQDPAMAVLRSHLDDPSAGWPVHRGLSRLADRVRTPGAVVALLCACADPARCHRSLIADALADRHFGGLLAVRDVRTGGRLR